MQNWLKEVARGKKGSRDLTYEEAFEAAKMILSGEATMAQTAAFLIAERMKEESPEELLAFVNALSLQTNKVSRTPEGTVDCAGPYGGRKTFAATIPVSLLLADKGIPVLLHGSDSLPPKYGSSLKSILSALDVACTIPIQTLERTLGTVQLGFADTEYHCPPLSKLREIRKEIGVRTLLNTVEKLLRVAKGETLMIGVFHKTAINNIIPVLQELAFKQVFIFQGVEGSEDIPIHRNSSFIYKVTENSDEMLTVKPSDYGFDHAKDNEKELITLEQQVSIIKQIINGAEAEELNYYRDQVIFNTGVRYWLLGHAPTIEDGITEANEQLRQGKAKSQLRKWQQERN